MIFLIFRINQPKTRKIKKIERDFLGEFQDPANYKVSFSSEEEREMDRENTETMIATPF